MKKRPSYINILIILFLIVLFSLIILKLNFTGKAIDESYDSKKYLIVDLNSGDISYRDSVPSSGWTDEYKTTKLVLRKIPAGTFMMGSPSSQPGRRTAIPADTGETLHQVILTQDFYIGVFKITQAQYQKIMGMNPSNSNKRGQNYPVVSVTWNSARGGSWPQSAWPGTPPYSSFVGKLSSKTGLKFDLPTEAMWEKACKAGTETGLNNGKELSYIGGGNDMEGDGTYDPNAADICVGGFNIITSVGTKKPNTWGLYDFSCNGPEWVLDWTSSAWHLDDSSDTKTNPLGVTESVAKSWNAEGKAVKMLKNEIYQGLGGARCADKSIYIWGDGNFYISDHPEIYGPSFRVAVLAPEPTLPSNCTNSDWSSSSSSPTCPREGYLTVTWTKTNANCINGVQHDLTEIQTCTYIPPLEERDNDGDGIINSFDKCDNTASNLKVNSRGCPLPNFGNYETSSITSSDLNSVTNFEIKNDFGSIKFNSEVPLTRWGDQLNIADNLVIEQNKIYLDSSNIPELNVPATLVFNNVNLQDPVVLKDGVLCVDCSINYIEGIAVVNIPGFSTYELVEKSFYDSRSNPIIDSTEIICNISWVCSNWSQCLNESQTRICSDFNNCNSTLSKPNEIQTCKVINNVTCTPNWQCSSLTPENCPKEQYRMRECSDMSNCNTNSTRPVEKQNCTYKIEFDWAPIIFFGVVLLIIALGLFVYFKFFKNRR